MIKPRIRNNWIRFKKFYKDYIQNESNSQTQNHYKIDEKFTELNEDFNNLKIEIEQDTK